MLYMLYRFFIFFFYRFISEYTDFWTLFVFFVAKFRNNKPFLPRQVFYAQEQFTLLWP